MRVLKYLAAVMSFSVCVYVCEHLLGKMLSKIAINAQDLIVTLRLPEQKYHCALLARMHYVQ